MAIRHVLWDNDGVLVDTEEGYFLATRRVLAKLGITLDLERYMALRSRGWSAWQLADEAGIDRGVIEQHRALRDDLYQEFIRSREVEIPGVAEIVAALARSHRMAIVTTSKRRDFDLIHREGRIVRHMEFVLTRENFAKEKPAPDGYLAALARFGASPDEAVVVEDSKQGLDAARAAGIRCLIVHNSFFGPAHDFAGAAAVLRSIDEVPNAIARLRG
jgi:HAD superfamily hydrolase (TIGR01509 family)